MVIDPRERSRTDGSAYEVSAGVAGARDQAVSHLPGVHPLRSSCFRSRESSTLEVMFSLTNARRRWVLTAAEVASATAAAVGRTRRARRSRRPWPWPPAGTPGRSDGSRSPGHVPPERVVGPARSWPSCTTNGRDADRRFLWRRLHGRAVRPPVIVDNRVPGNQPGSPSRPRIRDAVAARSVLR